MQARAIPAGLLFCTVVFGAGFVLAALRTVLITPLAGELAAVALEAPVMLAISWAACGWVAERLDLEHQFLDRLVMGGLALIVIIVAEAAAAFLAENHTLATFFHTHGRSAVLLGLLVQLAFAVFPLLHRRNGYR